MAATVFPTPMVGTRALARLPVTDTVAGAVAGADKLRAVLAGEPTVAGALV